MDVGGWAMPAEHHHGADFDKCHPGKAGVSRYHLKRNPSFSPTVNLDKLPTLVSEQTRETLPRARLRCSHRWCGASGAVTKLWGRENSQGSLSLWRPKSPAKELKRGGRVCVLGGLCPGGLKLPGRRVSKSQQMLKKNTKTSINNNSRGEIKWVIERFD